MENKVTYTDVEIELIDDTQEQFLIDYEIPDDITEESISITSKTKCPECDEDFETTDLLKSHYSSAHCQFVCMKCEKRYHSEKLLQKHLRSSHLESMNLNCLFCDKVFKSKYSLQQHLYTHSSERVFECTFEGCGGKFKHISTLKQHRAMHFLKNRKECPICKKFVTRIKQHMATHSEDERITCEECGRTYATEKFLQEHKLVHQGITHACDECIAVFKNKSSLYKHKKTQHSETKYPCPMCDIVMRRRDNLMVHIRSVHNMAVNSIDTIRKKGGYVKLMHKLYETRPLSPEIFDETNETLNM